MLTITRFSPLQVFNKITLFNQVKKNHKDHKNSKIKCNGFTLIELMIGIAIVAILSATALPSLNSFTVGMRVDNEINQIHRLVLTARNSAINMEQNVIFCPLVGTTCTAGEWDKELSVFIDINNNGTYESATDTLLKVKNEISDGDKLIYAGNSNLTFRPTGRITANANTAFKYCAKNHDDMSRSITISLSGRPYQSSDTDNDGKDEDRDNNEISC
ncbi:MAG: GspH/FimT family pseudopilin [Colwellia sp.]|nr:GspH/FimT family pseudopilin [Colwellia sp.]